MSISRASDIYIDVVRPPNASSEYGCHGYRRIARSISNKNYGALQGRTQDFIQGGL